MIPDVTRNDTVTRTWFGKEYILIAVLTVVAMTGDCGNKPDDWFCTDEGKAMKQDENRRMEK